MRFIPAGSESLVALPLLGYDLLVGWVGSQYIPSL